jgi:hypothetical protein
MKAINITYWITTSIVAFMMLFSVYAYFTNPDIAAAFQHLGYPDHLRVELAIAKLIGVALLLAPLNGRIKEWAYAGFTFTFIAAFLAHTIAADPMAARIMPVVLLLMLIASYVTYHRRQAAAAQRTTQAI